MPALDRHDAQGPPALSATPSAIDAALAELYRPDLLPVIRRALGPRGACLVQEEDVRQDLAARLLAEQRNQAGAPLPAALRAFICASARNEAANLRHHCFAHKRDPSREVSLDTIVADPQRHPRDHSPGPLHLAAFHDAVASVRRACTPLEGSILALVLEDYQKHEIAQRLGISRKAVRRNLRRLGRRIRAQLP
jgi:RNA polymerase sigma factor (sigma-70 family)